MTTKNKFKLVKLLLRVLTLAFITKALAGDAIDFKDPWRPENIVKAKGTQRPKEVLEWKIGNIPKDWKKIGNKYFTVSFPECVKPHGTQDQYDDPKHAEDIEFYATTCSGYEKKNQEASTVSFLHEQQYKDLINAEQGYDPTLLVQRLKINSNNAKMFAIIQNYAANSKDGIQLRWNIVTTCKDKAILIVASSMHGQESITLIDQGKYEFPEFFRKIVETFRCK